MVWVGKDHPAANCRNYAPLHRVVFFNTHGRMPLPGYNIHHVDGDKLNNAPENLVEITESEHGEIEQSRQYNGHKHPPLVKGSERARELGRKGGKRAARNRRKH